MHGLCILMVIPKFHEDLFNHSAALSLSELGKIILASMVRGRYLVEFNDSGSTRFEHPHPVKTKQHIEEHRVYGIHPKIHKIPDEDKLTLHHLHVASHQNPITPTRHQPASRPKSLKPIVVHAAPANAPLLSPLQHHLILSTTSQHASLDMEGSRSKPWLRDFRSSEKFIVFVVSIAIFTVRFSILRAWGQCGR